MDKLSMNDIREMYLSFFESKGHLRLPSFSLVPKNDKSLLLINAGMAPLKSYFTGKEVPPRKRVTTCQKCVRTGDLERVGKTARHGTFFEMLGNFSFGDYFKKEVIPWAWELVTSVYKLPVDRLWITIYQEDNEAFDIWHNVVGVPEERIIRRGKEDNFWEISTGPCGPCSELYFDRGVKRSRCGKEDCNLFQSATSDMKEDKGELDFSQCEDCDRFMEFWNLVFSQYDKDENGNYNPLPNPNIDTGMGLERMAVIIQDVDSIFEVDVVKAIMDYISDLVGIKYKDDKVKDVSLRIITDHARSMTFMVFDGILPSNEGRGYVLRRIIRRAARQGRLLGIKEPFLYKICSKVIEQYKDTYSEMAEKIDYIARIIKREEERFAVTIDQGLMILDEFVEEMRQNDINVLTGEKAFKLYDTYGFPLDLTKDILDEKSLKVDEQSFNNLMKAQKERARSHAKTDSTLWSLDDMNKKFAGLKTKFVGYTQWESDAKVIGIISDEDYLKNAEEGQEIGIILDITPFYAESGGQIGDTGVISNEDMVFKVTNTVKFGGDKVLHKGYVESGSIKVGDDVLCKIDLENRMNTARNHSATHLLHRTLRDIIGEHVHQAGSYVGPDRLRFDFTHYEQISADDLIRIENEVNKKIFECIDVITEEMPIEKAKALGAMALFDEKYGDIVRVVSIGDYSKELCGGTHVRNTSQIGLFKIIAETSVGAGLRRIEALTAGQALEYLNQRNEMLVQAANILKLSSTRDFVQRVTEIMDNMKELERQQKSLNDKVASLYSNILIKNAENVKDIKIVTARIQGMDINGLRVLGDIIRDKLENSVVILASENNGKPQFIGMATKDAVNKGIHVGNVLKEAAKVTGGGGGGKPDMAQAGGKDVTKIDNALNTAKSVLRSQIKG